MDALDVKVFEGREGLLEIGTDLFVCGVCGDHDIGGFVLKVPVKEDQPFLLLLGLLCKESKHRARRSCVSRLGPKITDGVVCADAEDDLGVSIIWRKTRANEKQNENKDESERQVTRRSETGSDDFM